MSGATTNAATNTAQGLTHLGIIADGNRRWAKERGLPTIEGHKKGLETIETLIEAAGVAGIQYVTFYVFSTENWGRSEAEVSYIMKLAESSILKYAEKMAAHNARLLVLGSPDKLSQAMQKVIAKAEKMTANGTGLTACFCFNYGGEQEIVDAAQAVAASGERVTPEAIRAHLYHPEVPDVDMIVRTSGEERISGFMLWRAAYSELMFLPKYFPEMGAEDIAAIVDEYQKRHRRFGK